MGSLEVVWRPDTGLPIAEASTSGGGRWEDRLLQGSAGWSKKKELEDYVTLEPLAPILKDVRVKRKEISSKDWADVPAPIMTPELKKEIELVRLRNVMDPKRHYKAPDSKAFPQKFQIGTVIVGPADFYSARLTKREQRASFADELLADSSLRSFRKRKYEEIQVQKQAGKKNFVKQKAARRKKSWAKF